MKVVNKYCGGKMIKNYIFNSVFEQQDTTTVRIFINQSGYETDKTKRATITNVQNGTTYQIKKKIDNSIIYTGIIYNQIADFTNFNNDNDDEMYIQVGTVNSYYFKVKNNYIRDISLPLALKFMEMTRQDAFDVGAASGYGWRDGHQFSFELNSLVMMYMANPNYYENLPRDLYRVEDCEYEELRVQNEPNIIWLIKFAVTRYYKWAVDNGVQLHALIKGQLAYFLYLYPHISQYITQGFYETIRDFTIQQWSVATCNKKWYEETPTHNLFATETKVGTEKGANPPGYSIIPNLMMYEVLKRDGLSGYQQYFDSAYNSCKWIVDSVDLDDAKATKGQRMSEHIVTTSLCYFYEMYPSLCPNGLFEKIDRLASVTISRSNNLWDYRTYRTKGDITGSTVTTWINDYTGTGGLNNYPGNTSGCMGVFYAMARVVTDLTKKDKLKQLAVTHIDHVFGRNPTGRHFCYTATKEFEGTDLGWVSRHPTGNGNLGYCVGVLDGAPKEASYPFNPTATTGYTEGWVAFNAAWNVSLAYLCAEDKSITNKIGIFSK